jgi:hypothetical protein
MATWRGLNWQRSMYGPATPSGIPDPFAYSYDPFAIERSLPRDLPLTALPEPVQLASAPTVEPLSYTVPQETGPSKADQAAQFARDVAYGESDWKRAGSAISGSGQYADASAARRAAAASGGILLGSLALASWIPGFNVFKPAQAARAARAFGTGAELAASSGRSMIRGGYLEAKEVERQRRAAVAAKKAADRQLSAAGAAAEQSSVYDVSGYRHLSWPSSGGFGSMDFDEIEKVAVQTNLQQRAINAIRVGREALDPSHPLRDSQRFVDQLADAGVIANRMDVSTYDALGNPLLRGPNQKFIYTLGESQPRVVRLAKDESKGLVFVPEITSDFIDYAGRSVSEFFSGQPMAGPYSSSRIAEGVLRHQGNAVLGIGDSLNVVSVFNNMDEAFSAAAARGRPYVISWDGSTVKVPDSYWPDRSVGQNILARYGTKLSSTGRESIPRRARDSYGNVIDRAQGGVVDQVPRGSPADLLARVLRDQSFDRLPTLTTSDDIARLQSEGYQVFYRGITGIDDPAQTAARLGSVTSVPQDNTKALKFAKDLLSGKYYAGTGSHGAGLYFTPHIERATSYTEGYGAIVTMAIPPNSRIMGPGEFAELGQQLRGVLTGERSGGRAIGPTLAKGFTGTPMQLDIGRVIAMLGYDGYIPYNTVFGYHRPELVLLNRSLATFERVPTQVWGGLP